MSQGYKNVRSIALDLVVSQEVQTLCDELSTRRTGGLSEQSRLKQSTASSADADFWGGVTTSPSARLSQPRAGTLRGQQSTTTRQGKGKTKGKLYPKAAAEDFWGGGTTSGASGHSTSAKPSKPASTPAPASTRPSAVSGKSTPSAAAVKSVPTSSNAELKSGGELQASRPKAKGEASAPTRVQLIGATSTIAGGGSPDKGGKGGKGNGVGSKPAATAPAVVESTPEWSGVACQCMAMKHDLVTNCTTCGKIACVVEGGFRCSFCGLALPVTGREPLKFIGSSVMVGASSSEGEGVQESAELKEAVARKDKLLLFDRTSASRTRVLDDQGDYFISHNWLSQKEREKSEAEEKARRDGAALQCGARRRVKLSIDIMGRRVIETQQKGVTDGGQEGGEVQPATEGVCLDLGSTKKDRGASAEGDLAVGAADDPVERDEKVPSGSRVGADYRPSLENTGLRGRAKEVYDVMQANLEKQGRRKPGGKGSKAGKSNAVPETSRVSLWRVQHDVAPDDVLRQSPLSTEMWQFEQRDEMASW